MWKSGIRSDGIVTRVTQSPHSRGSVRSVAPASVARVLVSSVEPTLWTDVIDAYGTGPGSLGTALPGAIAQGVLSLASLEVGSAEARRWIARLEAAVDYTDRRGG